MDVTRDAQAVRFPHVVKGIRRRVPRVDLHGKAPLRRQFDLAQEPFFLQILLCVGVVIVESDFADKEDLVPVE